MPYRPDADRPSAERSEEASGAGLLSPAGTEGGAAVEAVVADEAGGSSATDGQWHPAP